MSATADFTVAVLDCPTCCRHFIENYVVLSMHLDRVACPHCGAHYVQAANPDDPAQAYATPSRHARTRDRNRLHLLGQRRRKLQ
jgi:hypothetical protein